MTRHKINGLSQRREEELDVVQRGERRCRICARTFPRTREFFVSSQTCAGGIAHRCIHCYREYQARLRECPDRKRKKIEDARRRYQPVDMAEKRRKFAERAPFHARASVMRGRLTSLAKEAIIPVDLSLFTVDMLTRWLQAQPSCECCGIPFRIAVLVDGGSKCDCSPSLDRFEPSLGYVAGNVSLVCWRCNNLKRDASVGELLTVANWMMAKLQIAKELAP